MAKKSMIVKANRKQKFKVREYSRCKRCGRPHAVMSKFGICRICFRELAYKGQIPGVKKSSWYERKEDIIMAVVTDTIADMLTRIRNANAMRYTEVVVPASKLKIELARILKEEGFIKDYKVVKDDAQGSIVLTLKYGENKERVITGLKRISKPGLRVYAKKDEVPKVLNGLGIAVISTSNGVMTDKEARKQGLGGEVLAYIW